jgi:carboxymethylenebutenolidase
MHRSCSGKQLVFPRGFSRFETLNGDHEIYIYPNAGHGFAKSGRKRYNKEAAEDAWEKITVFLKKYL